MIRTPRCKARCSRDFEVASSKIVDTDQDRAPRPVQQLFGHRKGRIRRGVGDERTGDLAGARASAGRGWYSRLSCSASDWSAGRLRISVRMPERALASCGGCESDRRPESQPSGARRPAEEARPLRPAKARRRLRLPRRRRLRQRRRRQPVKGATVLADSGGDPNQLHGDEIGDLGPELDRGGCRSGCRRPKSRGPAALRRRHALKSLRCRARNALNCLGCCCHPASAFSATERSSK